MRLLLQWLLTPTANGRGYDWFMRILVLFVAAAFASAGYKGEPHAWSTFALWMLFTCRWWAPREAVGLPPRRP